MWISYLRRNFKILLLLTLSVGIFAAVFRLYDLPVEAVGYAGLLCLLAAALLFLPGVLRYSRRRRALALVSRQLEISLEDLPAPADALEAEYQALLRRQHEQMQSARTQQALQRQEMGEYYTLWAHQIKTPIAAKFRDAEIRPSASNFSIIFEKISLCVATGC